MAVVPGVGTNFTQKKGYKTVRNWDSVFYMQVKMGTALNKVLSGGDSNYCATKFPGCFLANFSGF